MTQLLVNHRPINLYTGVPQKEELQVYKVPMGQGVVITQLILNNPEDTESAVTLTINTQDVAVFTLSGKETKITNIYLVLKSDDYVALQQTDGGKISVSLNGSIA